MNDDALVVLNDLELHTNGVLDGDSVNGRRPTCSPK
jgi:hypothetical protein